jgi:polyphosphate:AMP phosphotransferase
MFDSAEVGHAIDRKTWDAEVPALRSALLNAQYDLAAQKRFPVIIVIGGVEGAGKGETVNLLLAWMDPRYIQVRAFPDPSDEERERPPMWRFWRALPPRGTIGILFGGWHTEPILERVARRMSAAGLDQQIQRIVRFERMLVDEGALLLKFWFHISKEKQRERLKALSKDRLTAWRVTRLDWKRLKHYDEYRKVSEHYIRQTSSGEAPWIVVEGTDPPYRGLTVGKEVLQAVRERLDEKKRAVHVDRTPPLLPAIDGRDVLQLLDFEQRLSKTRYEKQLERWQGRLATLTRDPRFRKHAVAAVFEGADAAGKGGAIRRITGALDARQYEVIPVAAPTEEERAQPYLWRFWRHVPRAGRFTIFDRSWYGRVLVERVEGFADEADWMRAYSEINDFEHQMARSGIGVVKFYLAITKEEQLKRFRERERTEFKRFKITDEDWRNRKQWEPYRRAACDMVDRTSTDFAPWHLVPSNDKYLARIQILKALCHQIERALERRQD